MKESIDDNQNQNQNQIIEIENDDEFNESESQELIQHLEFENAKLYELLEDLQQGIKPYMEFEPYLVDECYLYGCYKHGNPDLD